MLFVPDCSACEVCLTIDCGCLCRIIGLSPVEHTMSNIEGSTSAIPYQYPSGHLGHLTPEQTKHFIAFKQLCAERGLYKPKTGDTPASHGDTTLLSVKILHAMVSNFSSCSHT